MAEIVKMPKLSDTMTEGVVSKWHKKVGDKVKSGELLAEIETEKATMDFESFQDGVLLYIGVEEGKGAPVDSILAILGAAGEDYKALMDGAASATASASAPVEEAPAAVSAPEASTAPVAYADAGAYTDVPADGLRIPRSSPPSRKTATTINASIGTDSRIPFCII